MDETMQECPFCGNTLKISIYRTEEWECEEGTCSRDRLYCDDCGGFWWSEQYLIYEDDDLTEFEPDDRTIYGYDESWTKEDETGL